MDSLWVGIIQQNNVIRVPYELGVIDDLEAEGFNAATQKLQSMTNKTQIAAQTGRMIEGTVAQKYELPHGPHAMIVILDGQEGLGGEC